MSLSDYEVLLFKTNVDELNHTEITEKMSKFTKDNGYGICVVDNGVKWTYEQLEAFARSEDVIELTEEMAKKKENKVVILQARNFNDDDLKTITAKIHDALVEYDINILVVSNEIKLEKASTFFNRIGKHLEIFNEVKKRKKDDFKAKLENSSK